MGTAVADEKARVTTNGKVAVTGTCDGVER
jgi:hypothetical protein